MRSRKPFKTHTLVKAAHIEITKIKGTTSVKSGINRHTLLLVHRQIFHHVGTVIGHITNVVLNPITITVTTITEEFEAHVDITDAILKSLEITLLTIT